jgi:hypothetical protein
LFYRGGEDILAWYVITIVKEDINMNSTPLDTCNIDELIQLTPFAIVYVYRASLGLVATTLHWTSWCSSKTLLTVAVYLAGLTVLEQKQTQSRIARLIGHVSHDALHRLAEHLTPHYDQLIMGLLLVLESLTPGHLILDDVLIPKPFARLMSGAYPSYDHAQKRHVIGQRLVVLIWSNGVLCVPIAFVVWHHRIFVRTYRTKNQLARILVYWAVRHRIPCTYLTFDNWYASKQNLRLFTQLGLVFITKLRHNAKLHYDHTERHASWFRRFDAHYYQRLEAYVRQFSVEYSGYGTGQLALVTHDKHAEPNRTKYLFTNALDLTNQEFVRRYRSRWTIECFFRSCKQSFGLGACQAQMMPQVLLHIRMVFLAYTLMQFVGDEPDRSVEQTQIHLRSLECLVLPTRAPQLVMRQDDGRLRPVDVETLLVPLRTRIPQLQELTIPTIQEMTLAA